MIMIIIDYLSTLDLQVIIATPAPHIVNHDPDQARVKEYQSPNQTQHPTNNVRRTKNLPQGLPSYPMITPFGYLTCSDTTPPYSFNPIPN
jgi:hypothetical protein